MQTIKEFCDKSTPKNKYSLKVCMVTDHINDPIEFDGYDDFIQCHGQEVYWGEGRKTIQFEKDKKIIYLEIPSRWHHKYYIISWYPVPKEPQKEPTDDGFRDTAVGLIITVEEGMVVLYDGMNKIKLAGPSAETMLFHNLRLRNKAKVKKGWK